MIREDISHKLDAYFVRFSVFISHKNKNLFECYFHQLRSVDIFEESVNRYMTLSVNSYALHVMLFSLTSFLTHSDHLSVNHEY